MIAGTEKIVLLKKTYGNDDDYGNSVEVEERIVIENVLVGKDSARITAGLFGNSTDVDITIYVNKKYNNIINEYDEFEYENKRYIIVDSPILWKPQKGSPLKTKLIIGLKHKG